MLFYCEKNDRTGMYGIKWSPATDASRLFRENSDLAGLALGLYDNYQDAATSANKLNFAYDQMIDEDYKASAINEAKNWIKGRNPDLTSSLTQSVTVATKIVWRQYLVVVIVKKREVSKCFVLLVNLESQYVDLKSDITL